MADNPTTDTDPVDEHVPSPETRQTDVAADMPARETATDADGAENSPLIEAEIETPASTKTPKATATKQLRRTPAITARTAAVLVGTALVVGGATGGVIGFVARPAVNTTAEYRAMKLSLDKQLGDVKSQLGIANNDLDASNQHITDIADRETALTAGEAKLKADQAALDAQTKQVQSTQFGDGVHLVGTTITPGVYSISSGSNCYYAWMSGTGSDADIIDNNIVSGPAVVTLKAGDIFETNRCGTWTKIG